ncbi:S8 family serine peptidase [Sediminibacillus massiliensis]|uniref:S8 family serine peptidase n=1 Tax=Sediminibacillus massiliensis TaxID=1926277 RepID=UPI000BAE169C|nr:S8 family serine peptidase [Sediminibacillus massiliensis]
MRKLVMVLFLVNICLLPISPVVYTAEESETEQSVIIEVEGNPVEYKEYIEKYHPFLEVIQVYDTLFTGLAIKGKEHQLDKLENLDFVQKTYPVRLYQATIGESIPFLKQEENEEEASISFTGKGVKVGVIDTGIDYSHPDLSLNYKGGYDLVDLDDDPMETTVDQGEPTLHGTHVAGIIGAKGQMEGVAPEVELYGYRALGPGGMGTSVQVIAAMEKAVKDGMDILNMSLGSSINGPDWPTSVAVNRAIDQGVSVVIANGNEGPDNWTVGSPATSVKAISVGASTPPLKIPYLFDSFQDKRIALSPLMGSVPWDLEKDMPIIHGSFDGKPNGDARGKIVLLQRGKVPFAEKARRAEEAGAEAVIIYNNEKGSFPGSVVDGKKPIQIPVVAVTREDGEWLIENIASKDGWIDTIYENEQDQMADFSSRGPVTVNWDIKPEIVAPGAAITSTVPGGYQELQGTSMAAPHVAGGLALLKQAHPDWSHDQLKGALLTTALPIKDKSGKLYDPIVQGMGRMQIQQAIETATILHNPLITFGKIDQFKQTATYYLEVENTSENIQEYYFDIPHQQRGLRWQLPARFNLGPGQKTVVPIKLSITGSLLKEGIHQGWLTMHNGNKEFKLPYLFINKGADYPKAMGMEFALKAFSEDKYEYRMYLPEGAAKVTVDLYNPKTLRYDRTILELTDQPEGMVEGEVNKRDIGKGGQYLANLTIETEDEEQYSYPTAIFIE